MFDAIGRIEMAGVSRAGRYHQDIEIVQGEGVIGLRIPARPDVLVSASVEDNTWTFILGARAQPGQTAPLAREVDAQGGGRLVARFERDGAVRWIRDPEVGDRIGIALVGGPGKGVDTRRATPEAALLPAAHGAVIEPRADGVTAIFDGGNLVVSNGAQGLIAAAAATPASAPVSANAALMQQALSEAEAPAPASEAGMSLEQVRARIDELSRAAAEEGVREGASVEARMALARFLLANDLAPEALGALRIVAINQGALGRDRPGISSTARRRQFHARPFRRRRARSHGAAAGQQCFRFAVARLRGRGEARLEQRAPRA